MSGGYPALQQAAAEVRQQLRNLAADTLTLADGTITGGDKPVT